MRYLRETSDLRDADKREKRVAVKYAFEENKTGSDGRMLSHRTAKVRSAAIRFGLSAIKYSGDTFSSRIKSESGRSLIHIFDVCFFSYRLTSSPSSSGRSYYGYPLQRGPAATREPSCQVNTTSYSPTNSSRGSPVVCFLRDTIPC